jgi:hypothetical protein
MGTAIRLGAVKTAEHQGRGARRNGRGSTLFMKAFCLTSDPEPAPALPIAVTLIEWLAEADGKARAQLRKRRRIPALLTLVAVGISAAAPAPGQSITVPGFNFESPVTSTYNTGVATGWADSGDLAGYQHAAFIGMSGATGNQGAYANSGNSLWSAASLLTLASNSTYTLTVDVGSRSAFPSSGFQLGFYADSPAGGGTQFATTGILDPVDDNAMRPYQLSYTVLAGDAVIGKALFIRLSNETGSSQTCFDNVRLAAVGPPPATPSTGYCAPTGGRHDQLGRLVCLYRVRVRLGPADIPMDEGQRAPGRPNQRHLGVDPPWRR